jgi:YesN/AraC family two-component response regulator
VRSAPSAEAALAILDEFITPDVVVTDHRMAGMTGVELLQVIGARFPAARRVLLSGYVDIDVGEDIVFVSKPYVGAELLALCK